MAVKKKKSNNQTKSKPSVKKRSITKSKPTRSANKPTGFFHGLRTAVYFVDDVEKAKTWYSKALGIKPYFDTPYYVGFNVGGYELGIHPRDEKYPNQLGSVSVYWGVSNIAEAFEKLLKLGATSFTHIEDVGGGIKVAALKDPFGNVLGIIENPGFKTSA